MLKDIIAESIARTLFVCAYADAIDNGDIEGPKAGPGQDWMDIAPATPQRAVFEAWRLIGKIEAVNNNASLFSLYYAALEADGQNLDTIDNDYARSFGHYLAMECLGHGVAWTDDHAEYTLADGSEVKHPLVGYDISDLRD